MLGENKKRYDLQEELEDELRSSLSDCVSQFNTDLMPSDVFDLLKDSSFISITPPEEEPISISIGFMTMDSLRNYRNGGSIKPGNILLNWRELIKAIPSVVQLGVAIVNDVPVLKVCAALQLWNTIWNTFRVKISKQEAIVIVALWKNCNNYHKLTLEEGYVASKKLFEAYGESELTQKQYRDIIDTLLRMKCIELDEGIIWLCEWIKKRYVDKNGIC